MRFFERFTWLHVILVSVLVGALVGLFTYYGRPASFTATSSLLLSDRPDIVSGMIAGSEQMPAGPQLDRLRVIVTSRTLRLKLVEKFGLAEKLRVSPTEAVDVLGRMTTVKPMGEDGLTITVVCRGFRMPRLAFRHPVEAKEAQALCADLANAYVEQLRTNLRNTDLARAKFTREFLEKHYLDLTGALAGTEDELEGLRSSYELVEPTDKAARVSDRIRVIEQAYADASAEVSGTRNSLDAAQGKLASVEMRRMASSAEVRNPVLSSLEGRLADLQIEVATELSRGKTEENQDVQQLYAAIKGIEEQLAEAQETVLKEMSEQINPGYDSVMSKVIELHVALAGATARQSRYQSMLGGARSELADLPPVARMYLDITRRQDLQAQQLASVSQALWRARVEEQRSSGTDPFTVLDDAVPPVRRLGPPTALFAGCAFIAVLLLLGVIVMDRRMFGR